MSESQDGDTLANRALLALAECSRILSDDRPTSTAQCLGLDGVINPRLHAQFLAKERELEEAEKNHFETLIDMLEEEEKDVSETRTKSKSRRSRKKRSCKSLRPHCFDENGNRKHLQPRETLWCIVHCTNDPDANNSLPVTSKLLSKFRRRFRLPFDQFKTFLATVSSHEMFARWNNPDCTGQPPSPIGLSLLGALRHVGRGLTFDDLEEHTAIDEETHRQFFHQLIKHGEQVMFPQHVKMPTNAEEFKTNMSEFHTGGLWGAGFSADATNVVVWRCEHNLKQANAGWKNSHPARSYNVCVNHRRQILSSTRGHPSRWNDKTSAWADPLVKGTHTGRILQDVAFKLSCWEGEVGKSEVREKKCRGGWGTVDNGCHRWSCAQAPAKVSCRLTEQRLSDWIESFRKDIECTFGMLKGRWRILKTGVRLEGAIAADRIWLACCALHNMPLEVDGLNKQWDEGTPSDWEGEMGNDDVDDCQRHAPFAVRRLNNPQLKTFGSREHENNDCENILLSKERGDNENMDDEEDDMDGDLETNERFHEDGSVCINSLSHFEFRKRLVVHFDILHRQNRVRWPTRKKTTTNNNSDE